MCRLHLWLIADRLPGIVTRASPLVPLAADRSSRKREMESDKEREEEKKGRKMGSVHVCEPHTHTIREPITHWHVYWFSYNMLCVSLTHIIRDYKSFNLRVNAGLTFLLYVCIAHIHEPNQRERMSEWEREREVDGAAGGLRPAGQRNLGESEWERGCEGEGERKRVSEISSPLFFIFLVTYPQCSPCLINDSHLSSIIYFIFFLFFFILISLIK